MRSDTNNFLLSGSLIDQWNDISGNGNNAFQATSGLRPSLISSDTLLFNYPVVKFDGVNTRLETMFTQPDAYSIFIIYAHRNGDRGSFYSTNTSGYPLQRDTLIWPSTNAAYYVLTDSLNLRNLYVDVHDFQNNNYATYLNGIYRGGSLSPRLKSGGTFNIGHAIIEPLDGNIAEFLIYDVALSDSLRGLVEIYLMNRYAPPVNLGADINIPYGFCDTTLAAGKRFTSFLWSTGATTQTIQVNQSGVYWVTVTDIFGRTSSDTINITYPGNFSPFPDTIICYGTSIQWNTQLDTLGYDFLWSNGSTDSVITITQAGTYSVQVTDTNGCAFYSAPINVSVDSFSITASFGPDTSICSGASIGLVSGASTAFSYSWSTGESTSSIIVAPTSAGTYSFSLTVQNINGCTAKDTINVNVKGFKPTVGFIVNDVCLGDSMSFIDTSSATFPDGIDTWLWNFGDGNNSSVPNPSHTYTATGTYTTSLTITTDSLCTATIQKTDTVNVLPIANFNLSPPYCSGLVSYFMNASSISSGAIIQWNYDFGDGFTGTGPNVSHTYSAAGTYSVQLIVTSDKGCKDTIVKTITVFQSPTASITSTSVCEGSSTSFSGSGGGSYLWNFGDGSPNATLQNPTHFYSSGGTYYATLTVTGSNGCSNKDTDTVAVYFLPNAAFTGNSVCKNSPLQFTDISTVTGSTIIAWNWGFINGTPSSSILQNPTTTYTATGTYFPSLTVTSALGCSSLTTTQTVTVQPLPTANFSFSPNYGAPPLTVDFNSSLSSGATGYQWSFGDGGQSAQQNPSYTYLDTGLFPITLIAQNQFVCVDTVWDTIYVALPVLDIAVKTVSTVQSNNTVQVTAWLYNAGTLDVNMVELSAYLDNGTPVHEFRTGLIKPHFPATYTFNSSFENVNDQHSVVCVDVKKVNGKEDDVFPNNHSCSPITNEFTVLDPFPNPADDEIYFLFILPSSGKVLAQVYDVRGRLVEILLDKEISKGLSSITYNTIKLNKGMYFLKLIFEDKSVTKIFLKK
ncbi:MAG: PKD domain-containing protein [Bacteroidetes bacterium]|nr:PKD domain-containing protein [Bacteroidota bacterium]